MAKNNLDPLVDKFLARSRKRRTGGVSERDLTASKQTVGFRPSKQARVAPYRLVKRNRKTTY